VRLHHAASSDRILVTARADLPSPDRLGPLPYSATTSCPSFG